MSTNFIPIAQGKSFKDLKKDLKDDKIPNLKYHESDDETDTQFCITDGNSYIWCYDDGDNWISFTRYGLQDLDLILDELETYLGKELIDEYDPRYDDLLT